MVSELDVDKTQSHKDELRSKYADFWMAVFKVEFLAQRANKSGVLVPSSEIPPETKPIPHKRTRKLKPGYGDVPAKFKGHRTTIGYSQRPGIDYGETFAPVTRLEAFHIFLSIVAPENLEIVQIDIKTAFLTADSYHLIYMNQTEGFLEPGREDNLCLMLN